MPIPGRDAVGKCFCNACRSWPPVQCCDGYFCDAVAGWSALPLCPCVERICGGTLLLEGFRATLPLQERVLQDCGCTDVHIVPFRDYGWGANDPGMLEALLAFNEGRDVFVGVKNMLESTSDSRSLWLRLPSGEERWVIIFTFETFRAAAIFRPHAPDVEVLD